MTVMRRVAFSVLCGALLGAAPAPEPPIVRVRLVTAAGPIVIALDTRRAPRTSANFLAYVDDGRLDGTYFYRASRRKTSPGGFVQGGIGTDSHRMLDRLPLEPTNVTGIKHLDATVSMARYDRPDSGSGNFSIMVGPNPSLDARAGFPGYAAFAHVIAGMDVVKRILAVPTRPGGDGAFKGQMIARPIPIVRAVRLDGVAKPTGRLKVWQMLRRIG
ncbi:peptidylprolyl isomerase [Sphingomonas sp. HMP6]|uniref:peptidylprolyl isomerase n=1 Tax=Sphingomonas sp. HMP6 TaxID=1517551 RepID=UPI001599CC05|nr:peptidylprolyl isomerase [Sphingomonas sp. HMP6]BCA57375.1 peptidylprolyl isomerase [Sphingomonas sp. HMP6]